MRVNPTFEFEWVQTAEQLSQVAETLLEEPLISVDTETSGWQQGNEQLCLIQIGVPSTRRVILVDVLSSGPPLPLAPVLSAATPLIVAHNAPFEERQFNRYKIPVRGIRDTLTMARELRPDLPNHTLRTCCKLLLGVELDKQEQESDWSVRPLRPEQVDYARLDAEVALSLYDYLEQLEQRVAAELAADLPTLMAEYAGVTARRCQLLAPIAHEVAFCTAREARLREAIRQRLIEGAPPYDGPHGECALKKVKQTEVNVQRVREVYPEFADQVIAEHVDRKRFDAVAREFGLPKDAIQSVLDTVGFYERLTLKLRDESGKSE